LRINGNMVKTDNSPLPPEQLQAVLQALMNETQQAQFNQCGDVDFTYASNASRFRINIYQQLHGIAATFRVIAGEIPSIEALQLPSICQQLCQQSQGLILITGATGSGKSTTLAALLQSINQQQTKHIITLEDPIEFVYRSGAILSQST